jgi:hypothetical protein
MDAHVSITTDFLPFECSACHEVFCLEHRTFKDHNCAASAEKNVLLLPPPPPKQCGHDSFVCSCCVLVWGGGLQRVVPSCPLCGELIPVRPGEDVNVKVMRACTSRASGLPPLHYGAPKTDRCFGHCSWIVDRSGGRTHQCRLPSHGARQGGTEAQAVQPMLGSWVPWWRAGAHHLPLLQEELLYRVLFPSTWS